MSTKKDASIRVRVDSDIEHKLKYLCELEGSKPSAVIRELVESYVHHHPMSESVFDVSFEIWSFPDENPHSWYMFNLSAELIGGLPENKDHEIPFILPEFFDENNCEPFRVDSVSFHRTSFPNCIGEKGRFLGAKLTDRQWKGAIYVYKDSLLGSPEEYERAIKDKMKKNILAGLAQYLKLYSIDSLHLKALEQVINLDTASVSNKRKSPEEN
jgi:hypothetical protein